MTLTPRFALVAGLLMAIACDDHPMETTEVTGTLAAAATAARVRFTPTDTFKVGPVGARGYFLKGMAYDAAGQPVAGVVLKFYESSSHYSFSGGELCTTGADGSCSKEVLSTSTGTNHAILSWTGGSATRDTAEVKIQSTAPATAPKDTTFVLHVGPASATLDTGQTQRFVAWAKRSLSDSTPVTVAWHATGGTIDASGFYRAGSTAGSYRVWADTARLADTASVTVAAQASQPPPDASALGGCPSSGYTRLVNVSTASQLSSALSGAAAGDQIRVAAGTYAGNISWSRSGTASAPIVLCAATPGSVTFTGQWVMGGSYVTTTGFIWRGPASGGNLVRINAAHHVTFTRNEIRGGVYRAGLITQDVDHIRITYNYIHDNGVDNQHDHGIYFNRTTGVGNVIAENLMVHNAARGISIHDNSGVGAYDVLVAHNTIVANGSTGLLVNDGDRITVANNISAYNGEARVQQQIRVIHGDHNIVDNNLTWSPVSSLRGIENTTASPMSGNRIADPLFVAKYSNLHLQAGSPAIGMGNPSYEWTPDYDGKARGSSPDVGGYEY
jgi:hypothetical protein